MIETRIGAVEGVDDNMRKAFAKVSAPTLTTVRHLTGSHDIAFAWPAGEVGDGADLVRWQPLAYQMTGWDSIPAAMGRRPMQRPSGCIWRLRSTRLLTVVLPWGAGTRHPHRAELSTRLAAKRCQ